MEFFEKSLEVSDRVIEECLDTKKSQEKIRIHNVWIIWDKNYETDNPLEEFYPNAWFYEDMWVWSPEEWYKAYRLYKKFVPAEKREELEETAEFDLSPISYTIQITDTEWAKYIGKYVYVDPYARALKKKKIDPYNEKEVALLFFKEMKDVLKDAVRTSKEKGYKSIFEYLKKEGKLQKMDDTVESIEIDYEKNPYLYITIDNYNTNIRICDDGWYLINIFDVREDTCGEESPCKENVYRYIPSKNEQS